MTQHTPTTLALLVAASALAQAAPTPTPAWTQASNLALSTDYVFRGFSQIASSNALAFSGGTDLTHSSGLALGVWFSNQNVNSGTVYQNSLIGDDTLEADVYASYTFKVRSADLSVGVITYNYAGASAYNTVEANVGIALSGVSLKYSHSLTEYFAVEASDGTGYLDLSYAYSIGDLGLGLHYGWTFGAGNQLDYEDYKVSASYPMLGFTGTLAYTDANIPWLINGKELSKGTVVFSLSKTF